MNGAQDMGGMMGFGPVVAEADEPVFHARWEERVLAMTLAIGPLGGWSIDQSRFARENVQPRHYLTWSYYEIWFNALERLLAERGLVGADEIDAGKALRPPLPERRALTPAAVAAMIKAGRPTGRPVSTPARFAIGDRVRARNIHPLGHTRLPRYVRGHIGSITHCHGGHVFPDTSAAGLGECPDWLYTVRFTGTELWGGDTDPHVSVSVDAWESYLEPSA